MAIVLDTTAVSDEALLILVKDLNDYGEYDLDDTKIKALIVDAKVWVRTHSPPLLRLRWF